MAASLSQVLDNAQTNVRQSLTEVTAAADEADSGGPAPDNFWLEIGGATQQISTEVGKLTLSLSQHPPPSVNEAQSLVGAVEGAWQALLAAARKAPPQGSLLRKELRDAVLKIGQALAALLKALKVARGEQLQLTGWVWDACAALEKLPRDNLAAARALLAREELLLTDALQEIEEEVKCSRLSESEEVDNTATWTNQDRELLAPCVGLVRTARAALRKVGEAVRARGDCRQAEGARQLDRLAAAAEKLSPAVDAFVAAVYPPMNKSAVSAAALSVVTVVRELLELAQQSDCTVESDNEWLSFLLRAVDHNNNKVQPLLSPD